MIIPNTAKFMFPLSHMPVIIDLLFNQENVLLQIIRSEENNPNTDDSVKQNGKIH